MKLRELMTSMINDLLKQWNIFYLCLCLVLKYFGPLLTYANHPLLEEKQVWIPLDTMGVFKKINPRICSIFFIPNGMSLFFLLKKLPRLKNLDLPWWKGEVYFSPQQHCPSYQFLRVFPCIVNLFIMYRIFLIIFYLNFFSNSHLFSPIFLCSD